MKITSLCNHKDVEFVCISGSYALHAYLLTDEEAATNTSMVVRSIPKQATHSKEDSNRLRRNLKRSCDQANSYVFHEVAWKIDRRKRYDSKCLTSLGFEQVFMKQWCNQQRLVSTK